MKSDICDRLNVSVYVLSPYLMPTASLLPIYLCCTSRAFSRVGEESTLLGELGVGNEEEKKNVEVHGGF